MRAGTHPHEPLEVRRPFQAWSIAIPAAFDETFIRDGQYWHARDASRSVSLTSMTVVDGARRVPSRELLERLPRIDGVPVVDLPGRLQGCAAEIVAEPPAIAAHAKARGCARAFGISEQDQKRWRARPAIIRPY